MNIANLTCILNNTFSLKVHEKVALLVGNWYQ